MIIMLRQGVARCRRDAGIRWQAMPVRFDRATIMPPRRDFQRSPVPRLGQTAGGEGHKEQRCGGARGGGCLMPKLFSARLAIKS
eukprot:SAG11_NODE_1922_length_4061_cov_13.009339_2_plen_84_part_00